MEKPNYPKKYESRKRRSIDWPEEDEAFIKNNSGIMTDEEMANVLGRSLCSVRKFRQRLNIKKSGHRGYFHRL